jgi:hypothetical protein
MECGRGLKYATMATIEILTVAPVPASSNPVSSASTPGWDQTGVIAYAATAGALAMKRVMMATKWMGMVAMGIARSSPSSDAGEGLAWRQTTALH